PFGTLVAVNLDSGDVVWEVPFGRVQKFASIPGSDRWGSPNLGGSLVTAGGLVFAGGALDQRLHAFDEQTGAEIWSVELPAGVHAAPMTYVVGGRQFIVVVAGGHKDLATTPGDYIVGFSLPASLRAERGRARSAQETIAAGHYQGRVILDRTRSAATADITVANGKASIALVPQTNVDARGTGVASGNTVTFELTWQF